MKRLLVALVLLSTSVGFAAEEVKKEKQWVVGMGPAYSAALIGGTGTKYSVHVGYNQTLSERLDMSYFYNGSFNTGNQGGSAVAGIGIGWTVFTKDRGADTSPFVGLDIGYGGSNKLIEAALMPGIRLGVTAFRLKEASVSFMYRRAYTMATATGISSFPNVDQFMVVVNF